MFTETLISLRANGNVQNVERLSIKNITIKKDKKILTSLNNKI